MRGLGTFLVGLLIGLLLAPAGALLYLRYGKVPVAVTDPAFPQEHELVNGPLHARIDHEMPHAAPIEPSASNLLLGAEVYREQCAACHGVYGRDSSFAAHMYPDAPQLWAPHGHGVVGVSDDEPGETYWKVKNGIRLSGMPGYAKVLNETQMWQVTLLLANADKPVPAEVMTLLKKPLTTKTEPAVEPHTEQTHMPASALEGAPTQ